MANHEEQEREWAAWIPKTLHSSCRFPLNHCQQPINACSAGTRCLSPQKCWLSGEFSWMFQFMYAAKSLECTQVQDKLLKSLKKKKKKHCQEDGMGLGCHENTCIQIMHFNAHNLFMPRCIFKCLISYTWDRRCRVFSRNARRGFVCQNSPCERKVWSQVERQCNTAFTAH